MAIPKIIYQTFKTNQIPLLTRFYIWRFMRKNKEYSYEFYDDIRIEQFIQENFPPRVYAAYSKLQIGAAKADFFRYAILYRKGGIYLDLDGNILVNLDKYLRESDVAVISKEKSTRIFFAQWALIYDKEHPFLKRTLYYILENIERKRFAHDIHRLTGPSVYTKAINDELRANPDVPYRLIPHNYNRMMHYKYLLCRLFIYGKPSKHWRKLQEKTPAYRD